MGEGQATDPTDLLRLLLASPLNRLQLSNYDVLKVLLDSPIPAGSSKIGYVGEVEKLLAIPFTDSTTNLGISATYTGTGRDCQIDSSSPYCYYGNFRAAAYADQVGTLYIDESPDNTTWVSGVKSAALTAGNVVVIEHKSIYRYVRVRYVNGGVAQGSFRVWSRVS